MGPEGIKRKLTAILSADVAGFSRLMGDDEEATLKALIAARAIMSLEIERWNGRVVSTPGDAVLAEFGSVVDAMHCAGEIQEELWHQNAALPAHRRLEFRIGVHLGDVLVEGDDIYGDGVNVAARLQALADPGGTCISGTVYDSVRHKLDFAYDDLGAQSFKNIAESVRAFKIRSTVPRELGAPPGEVMPSARAFAAGRQDTSRRHQGAGQFPDGAAHLGEERSLTHGEPSIAVLPFDNMSGDPEQEYFADGVTEDLITALSAISGIFVIARNSVFSYKGKAVRARKIGAELGVRYLLEGSVRKAGRRVRITAQLIDVLTEGHLWAEHYDRDLQDIFSLQDEVTGMIVAALEVRLTDSEQLRMARHEPKDMKAYDWMLRGRERFMRFTKESNAEGQRMFQEAIDLDDDYATAHAWMARALASQRYQGWSKNPEGSLKEAYRHAQRAVDLDDTLPFALVTLALILFWKRQYEQAIAAVERAIEFDPNEADAHNVIAAILNSVGRPGEALKSIRKAMSLNPHYPVYYLFTLASSYFGQEDYDRAIDMLERGAIRDETFLPVHVLLAASYAKGNKTRKAAAAWKKCQDLKADMPDDFDWVQEFLLYKNPEDQKRLALGLEAAHKQTLASSG